MRLISIATGAAILASCAAAPDMPTRTAEGQREYQQLLMGKVAQPAVSCIPPYQANDMTVIDDSTIAFRHGPGKTYVNHMVGPCSGLAGGHYALVTRKVGTADTCRGDIAEVVDLMSHTTIGSCVFGDFTPYVRQGS